MKQELETPSSSESNSSPEPEQRKENAYGSPDGLQETIHAAELKRVNAFTERSLAGNKNKRILIGKEEKRSQLPIVDLSSFKEYQKLVKQYSDLAIASEYKAEVGETGFMAESNVDFTDNAIERGCESAQKQVQSDYEDSMFTIKRDGVTFLPNLIYFRLTPSKKVFLSFNIPQLRAIAHKKVVAEKLVADKNSSDFVETFKQFCFNENAEEADVVEAKCKEVRSAIFSVLQSQSFGVFFKIQFKETVDNNDFAILRIIQPYNKMEDFFDPLLWSLETDRVKIIAKTPIFNEGIACNGKEFHSALVLISFSKDSLAPSPPKSDAFPHTEIDVLARSSSCKCCVAEDYSKPCSHCKICIAEGFSKPCSHCKGCMAEGFSKPCSHCKICMISGRVEQYSFGRCPWGHRSDY